MMYNNLLNFKDLNPVLIAPSVKAGMIAPSIKGHLSKFVVNILVNSTWLLELSQGNTHKNKSLVH